MTKCEITNNKYDFNSFIVDYEDCAVLIYCNAVDVARLDHGRYRVNCYNGTLPVMIASIVCDEVIQ